MLNRYEQQIKLAEIGLHGQEQFMNLKVLCIGAGGLGSSLLLYLAAAGVGTIGIVDGDSISESNLHRQILYSHDEINRPKVNAAKSRIESLNPEININVYHYRANKENAATLISFAALRAHAAVPSFSIARKAKDKLVKFSRSACSKVSCG